MSIEVGVNVGHVITANLGKNNSQALLRRKRPHQWVE
jgi:hypothetical protein